MIEPFVLSHAGSRFAAEQLDAIRAHVLGLPHVRCGEIFYVFASAADRDQRRDMIDCADQVTQEFMTSVDLRDGEVLLVPVGDQADLALQQLATWCCARWPCELHYLGAPKTIADLRR